VAFLLTIFTLTAVLANEESPTLNASKVERVTKYEYLSVYGMTGRKGETDNLWVRAFKDQDSTCGYRLTGEFVELPRLTNSIRTLGEVEFVAHFAVIPPGAGAFCTPEESGTKRFYSDWFKLPKEAIYEGNNFYLPPGFDLEFKGFLEINSVKKD
jgi:hypothetical protein